MPSEVNPPSSVIEEDRIKEVMVLKGKKLPEELRTRLKVTHEFKKNEKQVLGFVYKHGMVSRVNYDSPFKGSLFTGDIIMLVNGQEVSFDEKTAESTAGQTSGNSKTRSGLRKEKKSTAMQPKGKNFRELIKKLFTKPDEAVKIELSITRMKMRFPDVKLPSTITPTPGNTIEGAVLYHFKHLKLGINMQQVGQQVVINYTIPDTVANASLNIGEVILAVDEKAVGTMDEVRQRMVEGFSANGYSKLIVEFPTTDMLKNSRRNQLAQAVKDADRPPFAFFGDVRKYCETGIDVLLKSKEPVSILRESKKESEGKELEKKKSTRKAATKTKEQNVAFREKTEVYDIPSEWNSKLFVLLPPLKSKETEMATAPATGATPPAPKK